MTRAYTLGRREESAAATRRRILDAATELMTASGFHPVAIDDIATRAGTTRPTVYRHFGSKIGLFEAVAWNVLSTAGIARLDEARQLTDPVIALREFLRENCRMFAAMGTSLSAALDAARHEHDIAANPRCHLLRPTDRIAATPRQPAGRRGTDQPRMDRRTDRRCIGHPDERRDVRVFEPAPGTHLAADRRPTLRSHRLVPRPSRRIEDVADHHSPRRRHLRGVISSSGRGAANNPCTACALTRSHGKPLGITYIGSAAEPALEGTVLTSASCRGLREAERDSNGVASRDTRWKGRGRWRY